MSEATAEAHGALDLILAREEQIYSSAPEDAPKIVEELQREMIRSNRYGRPLSYVMFGVELADTKSKSAAEARCTQLLRRVQARAGSVLRQSDHFGRLDECSVLVVLPETDDQGAEIVAQKLLAGGNTPGLVAQARKLLKRIYVSWRGMTEESCDVAALLAEMREKGVDFDAFVQRRF
ncbi:MAG: hypothetical protein AAFW46_10390 [Pseudomonadota bacterium]